MYTELKMKFDMKGRWQQLLQTRENVKQMPANTSKSEAKHSATDEECVAYANFINSLVACLF